MKTDELTINNLIKVLSEADSEFSISAIPTGYYPFSRVIVRHEMPFHVQPDLPSYIVKSGGWVE